MCLLLLSEVETSVAVPGRAFFDLGHEGYCEVIEGSVPADKFVDCFETHVEGCFDENVELEPRNW